MELTYLNTFWSVVALLGLGLGVWALNLTKPRPSQPRPSQPRPSQPRPLPQSREEVKLTQDEKTIIDNAMEQTVRFYQEKYGYHFINEMGRITNENDGSIAKLGYAITAIIACHHPEVIAIEPNISIFDNFDCNNIKIRSLLKNPVKYWREVEYN